MYERSKLRFPELPIILQFPSNTPIRLRGLSILEVWPNQSQWFAYLWSNDDQSSRLDAKRTFRHYSFTFPLKLLVNCASKSHGQKLTQELGSVPTDPMQIIHPAGGYRRSICTEFEKPWDLILHFDGSRAFEFMSGSWDQWLGSQGVWITGVSFVLSPISASKYSSTNRVAKPVRPIFSTWFYPLIERGDELLQSNFPLKWISIEMYRSIELFFGGGPFCSTYYSLLYRIISFLIEFDSCEFYFTYYIISLYWSVINEFWKWRIHTLTGFFLYQSSFVSHNIIFFYIDLY